MLNSQIRRTFPKPELNPQTRPTPEPQNSDGQRISALKADPEL